MALRLLAVLAVLACVAVAQQDFDVADLTTCKALATAVGVAPAGNTLICPSNDAFLDLAEELNFGEGAAGVQKMLAAAKANPAPFKTLLSYHAVKGVLPAASMKDGTALTTLLGPKSPLKVKRNKQIPDSFDLLATVTDVMEDNAAAATAPTDEEVVATDLTFEGPYSKKSTYVVHVVDKVLVPPEAAAGLKKMAPPAPAAPAAKASPTAPAAKAAPAAPAAKATPVAPAKATAVRADVPAASPAPARG